MVPFPFPDIGDSLNCPAEFRRSPLIDTSNFKVSLSKSGYDIEPLKLVFSCLAEILLMSNLLSLIPPITDI